MVREYKEEVGLDILARVRPFISPTTFHYPGDAAPAEGWHNVQAFLPRAHPAGRSTRITKRARGRGQQPTARPGCRSRSWKAWICWATHYDAIQRAMQWLEATEGPAAPATTTTTTTMKVSDSTPCALLLTNDDGLTRRGCVALYHALRPDHDVAVIAPDRNWSIAGHNKTMDRPLRVTERAWEGTRVSTPPTARRPTASRWPRSGSSATGPIWWWPGINKGPNLGDDITYSGTVAAAMEGMISEIPPIAVSIEDYLNWHFETAAAFVARLVRRWSGTGCRAACC